MNRISKLIVLTGKLLGFYILILFVFNLYLGTVNEKYFKNTDGTMIVNSATRFLIEKDLIKVGKKLDCSGYCQRVYKMNGISIPRSSEEQYLAGIDKSTVSPGDLVFFKIESKRVNHVGIYVGDSMFIHSPGINKIVKMDSLTSFYYKNFYTGSKNYIIFDSITSN